MKNSGTILLSAGLLLVGFSLLTPLLFFLIGFLLDKSGDGSMLLQMEHASLSLVGLVLLILGSIFSTRISLAVIISSAIAILVIAASYVVTTSHETFGWIVTGGYYLSLLTAFILAIVVLHMQHPSQREE